MKLIYKNININHIKLYMEIMSTSTDNFLFFFYTISTLFFFLNHINISNVICIQVFLDRGRCECQSIRVAQFK
jgi:hypothetical protein